MSGLVAVLFAAAVMAQGQPAPTAEAAPAEPPVQAPAAPAVAPQAKPAKPKPEKICVEEVATGSHFRRKVCATREEWARRRARDQEVMTSDAPRQ